LKDLVTADGHELRASFACSARALPEATERRMLEEVLLGGRYAVSDVDVSKHFEPRMHGAAAKAAQNHPVAQWLGDGTAAEMTEALRGAAVAVAFDCGVEILPPFTLDMTSPTFQQQQLRARQQALAEKQTAEQVEQVQRAAGLLKQFQEIRSAAPELSPGRVLEQISGSDRGAVLQTLLLASAKEKAGEQLWAVAGPYLVRMDRTEAGMKPQLFPLTPELGPLRSVQGAVIEGKRRLLIGARLGFMSVDPGNPSDTRIFRDDPPTDSSLGFSRVVYRGEQYGYAASHGAAGIVCWAGKEDEKPVAALRAESVGVRAVSTEGSVEGQAAGPRNLQVLDGGWLMFSAGGKLFVTDGTEARDLGSPSAAEIVGVLPDEARMIVVHEDGTICTVDRGTREVKCVVRGSVRVKSAGILPWLGSVRVLLAEEVGPVSCVGIDDPLVTQYQSPHRGLRTVAGSRELVAGISPDRQRLLVWNSWDGRQPLTEIYLTGVTRHRIADVDFG
jgi:hypothetical protein